MGARGRKSAMDKAVTPIGKGNPPEKPPSCLSTAEAKEWTAIVSRMPSGWFQREHQPMLEAYCSHTCRHRLLRAKLLAIEDAGLTEEDAKRYEQLSKAADRESRSLLAHGRAMRLTQQSQCDAQKASRQANKYTGPKPWEFDGEPARRRSWEMP